MTDSSPDKFAPFEVALEGSGKTFAVQMGESILAASRRAKLALPYSCLSGRCGTCSARVISGSWQYQHPPSALSALEHLDHALLCQALATSDLVLKIREVDDVADLPIVQVPARLIEKRLLTSDVLIATLKPERSFRYLAGQYLEFVLPDGKRRPFSIANAPNAEGTLDLHVRRVAGGGFTASLFDDAAIGDQFLLDVPHGTFVPRQHSDRPMLFVAGGTGFAPIKALLEHFHESPNGIARSKHLYWGAREPADYYLLDIIPGWIEQGLSFSKVLSEPVSSEATSNAILAENTVQRALGQHEARYSLLHEAVLDDYPDLSAFDLYMSGPPAMIGAARAAFLGAGLPEERLYYDSFDFAPDVLAALIQARARSL